MTLSLVADDIYHLVWENGKGMPHAVLVRQTKKAWCVWRDRWVVLCSRRCSKEDVIRILEALPSPGLGTWGPG